MHLGISSIAAMLDSTIYSKQKLLADSSTIDSSADTWYSEQKILGPNLDCNFSGSVLTMSSYIFFIVCGYHSVTARLVSLAEASIQCHA